MKAGSFIPGIVVILSFAVFFSLSSALAERIATGNANVRSASKADAVGGCWNLVSSPNANNIENDLDAVPSPAVLPLRVLLVIVNVAPLTPSAMSPGVVVGVGNYDRSRIRANCEPGDNAQISCSGVEVDHTCYTVELDQNCDY